jgi:nondiscriminating glutamyl-tRNA synthetase
VNSKVRVRFAPSPTGYLHVGGARTALYNYLFAKNQGGEFILRIEDTDEARSTDESLRMQVQDLAWLGLTWIEGVDPVTLKDVGPHGPYRQSERRAIYQEHAQRLIQKGKAYYCFLTDAEIEQQKSKSEKSHHPHQVISPYRDRPLEEALARIQNGEKPAIRFKNPAEVRDYRLNDLVRGEISFPSDMVGDFVLVRSSGMPVYNFCCVVDDALMKITHVLRAEEHLSNTLRQMMIYEGLDYPIPQFGHLSIILGSDRQKLSKRHGATSCNEYRLQGYLPDALLNFIALLGWSAPNAQEIFSLAEMVQLFDLDRMHSAAAVFDEVKLKWVNASHLRALPHENLWKLLKPFFDEAGLHFSGDAEWRDRALGLMKTSMETLVDAVALFKPLSETPLTVDADGIATLAWPTSKTVIETWKQVLTDFPKEFMTEEDFNAAQEKVKQLANAKGKFLFMPIRVAVIGQPHGAELKLLVPLLSRKTLIERADKALQSIPA